MLRLLCFVACSQLGDVSDVITVAPGQTSTVQQLLEGEQMVGTSLIQMICVAHFNHHAHERSALAGRPMWNRHVLLLSDVAKG